LQSHGCVRLGRLEVHGRAAEDVVRMCSVSAGPASVKAQRLSLYSECWPIDRPPGALALPVQ
jgi:hypothetical protein